MTKFNMSTLLSLVAFCFALVPLQLAAGDEEVGMPVLESKWDLPVPDLFFCDSDVYIFRFSMSDLVANDMVKPRLSYGENCENDILNGQTYLVPNLVYDEAPLDPDGNSVRQIAYTLDPDVSLIGSSPVYSISDDGSTGTLKFCLGLDLYLPDKETLVIWRDVEYLQTSTLAQSIRRKLEIQVDNTLASFQNGRRLSSTMNCTGEGYGVVFENWWKTEGGVFIEPVNTTNTTFDDDSDGDETDPFAGIIVGPAEVGGIQNAVQQNISFNLNTFICDINNEETQMPSVYNQGDLFRLCIEPDGRAKDNGLFLQSLDSMKYSKPTASGTNLEQYAVEGGVVDPLLSSLQCSSGSSLCSVQTILKAEFFASKGDVEVVGVAKLQFGDTAIRNLHQRELQTQDLPQERGSFAIKFPVTTFEEALKSANESNTNSMSVTQAILLVVLTFVFVMNSVFIFWIRQSRRIYNTEQGRDQTKHGISKAKSFLDSEEQSQVKRKKKKKHSNV